MSIETVDGCTTVPDVDATFTWMEPWLTEFRVQGLEPRVQQGPARFNVHARILQMSCELLWIAKYLPQHLKC